MPVISSSSSLFQNIRPPVKSSSWSSCFSTYCPCSFFHYSPPCFFVLHPCTVSHRHRHHQYHLLLLLIYLRTCDFFIHVQYWMLNILLPMVTMILLLHWSYIHQAIRTGYLTNCSKNNDNANDHQHPIIFERIHHHYPREIVHRISIKSTNQFVYHHHWKHWSKPIRLRVLGWRCFYKNSCKNNMCHTYSSTVDVENKKLWSCEKSVLFNDEFGVINSQRFFSLSLSIIHSFGQGRNHFFLSHLTGMIIIIIFFIIRGNIVSECTGDPE